MVSSRFIQPYIKHGKKGVLVKKITVSIPLHILKCLSNERTRRQTRKLRHATNSELLCEAFLHAFTGQPLPTDEELRRDMAMKKTTAKKTTVKKPAKKVAAKKAVKKTVKAKTTTVRKTGVAKKPAAKKPAAKSKAKKA